MTASVAYCIYATDCGYCFVLEYKVLHLENKQLKTNNNMKKNLLFIFALLCTIVQGTRAQGVIDLSQVNSELYLFGGEVLTGTLIANVKISVADGAHITLRNVTIPGSDMFTEYENTEFHSSTKEIIKPKFNPSFIHTEFAHSPNVTLPTP